jgi:ABC-type glycerol-3-phosphate transport system substrate-binding protein
MKTKRSKWHHLFLLVVGGLFAISLLACGGSSKKSDQAAQDDHFTLRMVRVGNTQDPTKDRILLELQKRLNFKLELISIPWDQFPSKMNMMVASGDPIDLLMCSDTGSTFFDWADSGLLWSYEELFEMGDYPLCEAVVFSDMYMNRISPKDGKHYGKPMATPAHAWGPVIRTDWLKKLNLPMPKTVDDLYRVLKAFAENDLDGTDAGGIDMRVGGAQNDLTTLGLFGAIQRAYNINPGDFNFAEQADGSLALWNTTDGAKEAARFIRKLLNDGLLNHDFATMPQESDQGRYAEDFALGRLGIGWTSNPGLFLQKMKAVNPNATLAYLPPLTSKFSVPQNSGTSGGYWYVHAIPKTAKNPARVMEILEYGLSNEGRELTYFGIEGIHYTDKKINSDGSRMYTMNPEECAKDWDISSSGLRYPLCWGFINYHAEIPYIPIEEYKGDFDKAYKNSQSWLRNDQSPETIPEFAQMVSSYSVASPLLLSTDPRVRPTNWNAMISIYLEFWLKAIYAKTDREFETRWTEMKTKIMENGGQELIKNANEVWKEMNS